MFDLVVQRCKAEHASVNLAPLEDRLKKLEGGGHRPKDRWEIFQIFIGILTPVALIVITYLLNGRVELALKKSQARVGTVKEMQSLILEIVRAGNDDKASEAAVALAAYGEDSIDPLMNLLHSRAASVARAAKEGLLTVGAGKSQPVCDRVSRILANRTRLYTWEEHAAAVDLIAALDCRGSDATLTAYRDMLARDKLEKFATYVSRSLPPDQDNFDSLQGTVMNNLALLKTSHGGAR
jgi:hypothetical protein